MARRPRKPKASPQLAIPTLPPGLPPSQRDEYELLATFLAETTDKANKADTKLRALSSQLGQWRTREAKLRAQLLAFEPELDGIDSGAPVVGVIGPPPPPEQPQPGMQ